MAGSVWQRTVVDEAGNVMPGASVEVRDQVTSTLVQLYSDYDLATPIGNPTTADADGFVRFYAATGRYRIQATSGAVTRVWENEILGLPAANIRYDREGYETSAGSVPLQFSRPPLDVRRFYSGTGTITAALQDAVNAAYEMGALAYLPAEMGEVVLDDVIVLPGSRSGVVGDGQGNTRILLDGCNGFEIPAGSSFNCIAGMTLAQGVRYSTTPNSYVAINIQGTTASQCLYGTYRDLFIDGFHTPIEADAVVQNLFHNIRTVFSKNGLTSIGVSIVSTISDCWFVGCADTTSFGLDLGDGVLDQEGWVVHDTTIFDFWTQIRGTLLSSWIHDCTLDATNNTGILLRSSATAPSINNVIRNNYIGIKATATGSAGIQLANDHAASDPQNNGTIIDGNEILQYTGAGTLDYGIIVDGAYDKKAIIINNRIRDTGTADIRLEATATEAIVDNNQCYGAGYSFATGANPYFGKGNRGTVITTLAPSVASAAALTLPVGPDVFTISGTTNITSIVATGHNGKIITLIFDGVLTLTDGGNILLHNNTNLTTSSNDAIQFYCNGTDWIQVGPASVN